MGTKPEIFITNSRSMLAHENQMRYAIEYSVAIARGFDKINISDIEDALSGMLFSSKGSRDYEKPNIVIQYFMFIYNRIKKTITYSVK